MSKQTIVFDFDGVIHNIQKDGKMVLFMMNQIKI